MSIKSDFHEAAVLNVMRGTSLTAFTPHAALASAVADGEAGTFTELSGTGYARQPVTFGAPTQVGGAASISNSAIVDFGTAGAAWGTATHVLIMDAASGGNVRYVIALDTAQPIVSGNPVSFPVGTLTVREA